MCCHVAFWNFSVEVRAFVIGLSPISSFFSYESEVFFGRGNGVGLFWASCSEDQNMGCYEVKWT